MTTARKSFLKRYKAFLRYPPQCCCDRNSGSGGGGGEPPECVVPVLNAVADFSLSAGSGISVVFSLSAGTGPLSWSVTGLTGDLYFDSGLQTLFGTMPNATVNIVVTAENACGEDSESVVITPVAPASTTIRWGNFIYAGFPAPGPVFLEGDFTGSNANYIDSQSSSAGSRVGSYYFPGRAGARQVLWFADTLLGGSPTFTLDGSPFVFDPAANMSYQALTIAGVPGHVYFSADQNTGTVTIVAA